MLPVIPGKACIVFVSGVGRKIVQVPVALFLQVSIPGFGTVYQFCNFFIHFSSKMVTKRSMAALLLI